MPVLSVEKTQTVNGLALEMKVRPIGGDASTHAIVKSISPCGRKFDIIKVSSGSATQYNKNPLEYEEAKTLNYKKV